MCSGATTNYCIKKVARNKPSDPGLNMSTCLPLATVLLSVPSINRQVKDLSCCFHAKLKKQYILNKLFLGHVLLSVPSIDREV